MRESPQFRKLAAAGVARRDGGASPAGDNRATRLAEQRNLDQQRAAIGTTTPPPAEKKRVAADNTLAQLIQAMQVLCLAYSSAIILPKETGLGSAMWANTTVIVGDQPWSRSTVTV